MGGGRWSINGGIVGGSRWEAGEGVVAAHLYLHDQWRHPRDDHTSADYMVSHIQQQAKGYPSREVIVLAKSWNEVKDIIQGRGICVARELIEAKKAVLWLFASIS